MRCTAGYITLMQYVKPMLCRCGKALAIVILCASAHAQMALPRHAPYPGGVAVVKLNAPGNQGPATAMNRDYSLGSISR